MEMCKVNLVVNLAQVFPDLMSGKLSVGKAKTAKIPKIYSNIYKASMGKDSKD